MSCLCLAENIYIGQKQRFAPADLLTLRKALMFALLWWSVVGCGQYAQKKKRLSPIEGFPSCNCNFYPSFLFFLFCFGLGWVGFFWLILKLFTTFVFVRSLIERLKLWFAHYTSCPTLSPICNPWSPALHHSGRKKSRKHVVWCACTNHCITSLLCFFPSNGFKVQKAYRFAY